MNVTHLTSATLAAALLLGCGAQSHGHNGPGPGGADAGAPGAGADDATIQPPPVPPGQEGADGGPPAEPPPAPQPRPDVWQPVADAGTSTTMIEVPVRVHLMRSDAVPELQSQISDPAPTFEEVNRIWNKAGVRFVVESTVEQQASLEDEYKLALKGGRDNPHARTVFLCEPGKCFFDTNKFLRSGGGFGFNAVFVQSMGAGKGGVFNTHTGATIFAEARGAKVLAHELGHAFGLGHVDCSDPCNLMLGQPCSQGGTMGEGIDSCQAEIARTRASGGSPSTRGRPSQASDACPCATTLQDGSCVGAAPTCDARSLRSE